ncbi:hypothetical protein N7509_013178 [Penicillium cosmopolitanum]|uniref:Uncharacterized protein n=1 Tax=Penicillium cosmopolitanum TaxID=1131564 RepID=A0A9W9SDS7_9EURO|nr:uncharacterized protein N7509_013178 [Penicillium cosmopolitanum]KAJ5376292.1 hypothetical protein N7509_013178 [Penicillium cosmopolitanum]
MVRYYERSIKLPFSPELRLNSPYWQNVLIGVLVGLTAGLYVSLNLLGAGGGKPNSASTVQVVNATLCTVWFFSASFGGTVLNTIGPAITACLGVIGYIIYVGSLMYFDNTGKSGFPIFAGVAIGISAGLIFVTMGSIAMSYSEEQDRGAYITMSINLQAVGSVIGGIIPLIINKDSSETTGVPSAVYIVFMVMMGVGACAAFLLMPPSRVIRDDGTQIALIKPRGFMEELKANLEIFRDWKLLIMVPAFLPAETFLVYGGSVNAYRNNLRTRCLLSFLAVVIQIPCGILLQYVLDHKKWNRRNRAFLGLVMVGIPLIGAWIWEIIRVRNYDRHNPPAQGLDWTEPDFWPILGVFRGFLGAGEAICFGVDSLKVPFMKEAAVIFTFYTSGVLIFTYIATFHIKDTEYFNGEDDVVIPKHVLSEHANDGKPERESTEVDEAAPAEKEAVSN